MTQLAMRSSSRLFAMVLFSYSATKAVCIGGCHFKSASQTTNTELITNKGGNPVEPLANDFYIFQSVGVFLIEESKVLP